MYLLRVKNNALASLQPDDKKWYRKKISARILNITGKDRGQGSKTNQFFFFGGGGAGGGESPSLRLKSFGLQKLPLLPLFTRRLSKITTTFNISYISQQTMRKSKRLTSCFPLFIVSFVFQFRLTLGFDHPSL